MTYKARIKLYRNSPKLMVDYEQTQKSIGDLAEYTLALEKQNKNYEQGLAKLAREIENKKVRRN